jgi:hypothetical protein
MGMFQAATLVRGDCEFPAYLDRLVQAELDWFNSNLPIPAPFSRSYRTARKRYKSGTPHAVSWFLPDAQECISHGQTLVALLSDWTFPLTMRKTSRPGAVIYNDAWQIVAVPFRC